MTFLSANAGPRLHFLADGFYSANWDDAQREGNRTEIYRRLREDKDVDLIITMGTWAALDMVTDGHSLPVMALSCSDAYGAGLMKTPLDSGRDNVYITVEPDRWPRQLVFFNKLFGFKRLGITYENTRDGRSQAGIDTVEKVAGLLGVTLVPCTDQFDVPDAALAYQRLLACHEKLAPQVDAMYLTVNSALVPENIPKLIEPFTRNKVPTFAQLTPGGVASGILLDIAQEDLVKEGEFAAKALGGILNGTPPRRAPNWLETDITISFNLDTARKIGWKPPFAFLLTVDTVYSKDTPVKSGGKTKGP